jgi:RNA binding exosome subunit
LKSLIQSIEVTYLVHATEDPEKVRGAIGRLLGVALDPEIQRLEGHFGNEIQRARVHLTGEDAARAFEHFVGTIHEGLKKEITGQIEDYTDEHSALFLRLDKQRLVAGSVAIGSGDSVRVKVKPRVFLIRGGAGEFYRRLMGGE